MDFIGIILTFASTSLITISRLISDKLRFMRNLLVYLGIAVSGGAVYFTYQNIQASKHRLQVSESHNIKLTNDIENLNMKMYGLSGQIQMAADSLFLKNDSASLKIAERLRASTGVIMNSHQSSNMVINTMLRQQNDSLVRVLNLMANQINSQLNNTELHVKEQLSTTERLYLDKLAESEAKFNEYVVNSETRIKEAMDASEERLKTSMSESEDGMIEKLEETESKLHTKIQKVEENVKTSLSATQNSMNAQLNKINIKLAEHKATEPAMRQP